MELTEIRTAVPGRHQLCKLFLGPVVALVRGHQFLEVKPGSDLADKVIQAPGDKLTPGLGIVLGPEGGCLHILRGNGHAPGGICLLPGDSAQIVEFPGLRVRVCPGDKAENTIRVRAGYLSSNDFADIGGPLGAEADTVVSGRGGAGDKFVSVGLCSVSETGVRGGIFI